MWSGSVRCYRGIWNPATNNNVRIFHSSPSLFSGTGLWGSLVVDEMYRLVAVCVKNIFHKTDPPNYIFIILRQKCFIWRGSRHFFVLLAPAHIYHGIWFIRTGLIQNTFFRQWWVFGWVNNLFSLRPLQATINKLRIRFIKGFESSEIWNVPHLRSLETPDPLFIVMGILLRRILS